MPYRAKYFGVSVVAAAVVQLAFCCNLSAAEPVLRVVPESLTIFVGQRFTVTVLVEAARQPAKVDLSSIADFHVSEVVGAGGTLDPKTGVWAYQYHLVSARAGDLTIGPVYVTLGGRKLIAPSVAITVLQPEKSPDSQIEVKLSALKCFVDQPLRLTVTWRLAIPFGAVKAVDLRLPVMRDPRFDVLDIHIPSKVDRSADIGMPVSDTRIIATAGAAEIDGRKFSTLTFEKIIIPRKSGLIEIPGASVLCAVLPTAGKSRGAWNRYVSYFDNEFFNKDIPGDQRRIFAMSEPIRLQAAPLPLPDRPDIVGRCGVAVSASPTSVLAGAPITLTVRITGHEVPETINLPPLSGQNALAIAFAIPRQRSQGRIVDGAAVFTQTIRPLSSSVTEIPPIELSYFDPQAGKYATVRSAAIAISVSDAPVAAIGGAPESFDGGLRHNYYGPQVLADQGGLPTPGGELLSLGLLIGPPGLFVVLAVLIAIRRRKLADPASTRARAATGVLRKRLTEIRRGDPPDALEKIDRAMRAFFDHADVDGDIKSELARVLDDCRAQRFGHASHAACDVIDRIEEALQ
jgi:hypothetical protein